MSRLLRPTEIAARIAVVAALAFVGACSNLSDRSPSSPTGASVTGGLADKPNNNGGEKHFTVVMTPSSVAASTTGVVLHVVVTNCGASSACGAVSSDNQELGRARIVVPSGFTVTGVSNFTSFINSHGTKTWSGNITGNTVDVGGLTGTDKMPPGQSVEFDITVNTPATCSNYGFATPQGSNDTLGTLTPTFDWNFHGSALSLQVTGCSTCTAPAAPAIATHYLNDLGIPNNSDPAKNIIAQVANHMTTDAHFDGLGPCDPGYADAVKAFVDGILATLTP